MKKIYRTVVGGWDQFFFAPVPSLPVGIFRFVFGLNAFIMYALRFLDWRFYFTDIGFVKADWALEVLPEFFRPAVALYPTSESATFVLQLVFLAALALLTVGLWSRWMALVAFLLHTAFLQRNFSIAYGADIVNSFFLFGLIFAASDRAFSLRRYLWPNAAPQRELSSWFGTIGVRLIQVQLCIIYGYTGMEKLKGPTWWDGTAIWAVLGNPQIRMFDTSWLRHFPLVIAVMTLTTLAWEIYFPVLVWVKPLRKWILFVGAMIHVGIALAVGLIFFSTAMVSTYFVFIDEASLEQALKHWPFRPKLASSTR